MIILTILAWSPRWREIISGLVCLPFSYNCSHSCFIHTKLLACCRFTLPSLVQVYNFLPGVLRQLFGLWLSLECDSLRLWTGVFDTDNIFFLILSLKVEVYL